MLPTVPAPMEHPRIQPSILEQLARRPRLPWTFLPWWVARLRPRGTTPPERGTRMKSVRSPMRDYGLLAAALAGLAAGGVAYTLNIQLVTRLLFATTAGAVLIATAISTVRKLLSREIGVDLIAVFAMAGALLLGEYLAGAIIAVMLTGGSALERFAIARARRELSALVKRAPRVAHRRAGVDIVEIDVNEVAIGDLLLVKPGEVVPVDGIVSSPSAVLDESALTGESKPVQLEAGAPLRSGGTNAG